jgi:hypothetical protein
VAAQRLKTCCELTRSWEPSWEFALSQPTLRMPQFIGGVNGIATYWATVEHNTNLVRFAPNDVSHCAPSASAVPTGIRISIGVMAETLFEATALALSLLRKAEWSEPVAPGTELEVRVREPETRHTVTVAQIRRWCDGVAVSPDEVLKRKRVKELLA